MSALSFEFHIYIPFCGQTNGCFCLNLLLFTDSYNNWYNIAKLFILNTENCIFIYYTKLNVNRNMASMEVRLFVSSKVFIYLTRIHLSVTTFAFICFRHICLVLISDLWFLHFTLIYRFLGPSLSTAGQSESRTDICSFLYNDHGNDRLW